jgi:ABC-type multidrug transport system ATPase subunit
MAYQIVSVEHLRKAYGKRTVLQDVSFQLRSGEIVGIVGENGSGKTTLLKVLVGLLTPDAGTISLNGCLGYCPQDMLVFDTLTVRENFQYFATAYGLDSGVRHSDWRKVKSKFQQLLKYESYDNTLVSSLSGGTKQKLNFSLSVLHEPDLLVLDEPYSGFDWETYLHFWNFTMELRSQNKSILVVSHFVYDRSKFDILLELKNGVLQCV